MAMTSSGRALPETAAVADPESPVTPERLAYASLQLAELAARVADAAVAFAHAHPTATAPDDTTLLDVAKTAELLDVPESQVRRLVDHRALGSTRVGRYLRISVADLRTYLAARRTPGRLAPELARGYTPTHEKHRPPAPPAPPGLDPERTRGRARRSHDDRLAVGDRAEPDPAARRDRANAVRGARGDNEPLDVGAADAFPAEPEG